MEDLREFLDIIGSLKDLPRTGWLNRGVPLAKTESVASHMWRASIMAFTMAERIKEVNLNREKSVMILIAHDIGECIIGDITPDDKSFTPEGKAKLEMQAIEELCNKLNSSPIAKKHLHDLFLEYENNETIESKFAHDIDKLDMFQQAAQYQKKYPNLSFDCFFTKKIMNFKELQSYADMLYDEVTTNLNKNRQAECDVNILSKL